MPDWTSPIAAAYNAERPEPYFALSARAGYVQPDNVLRYAARVYPTLIADNENPPAILDVGCGYGAFGALARKFGTVEALYRAAEEGDLHDPASLPDADTPLRAAPIVGLDVSASAAAFAEEAGFVDRVIVEDLTVAPPSPEAAAAIRACRLVLEVGAAWPAVIDCLPHLLSAYDGAPRPKILLSPRGDTPMDRAFNLLEDAGYTATRLTDEPLRFRNFIDDRERALERARAEEPGTVRVPSDAQGYRTHVWLFEPRANL